MKNRGDKWTESEISLAKELYLKGIIISDIAPEVNHSNNAVVKKLQDIGLTGNRKALWTDEDVKQLKELFDNGFSYQEIAKIMNKSPRGCQAKAVRIGLIRKDCNVWKDKNRADFWTDSEIETLKKCISDGLFMKEIVKKIGRSEKSIYCKMNALNLHLKERTEIEKANYRRAYSVDDGYFENVDTQKKSYWLGWLVTDGYVLTKLNTKRGITNNNSISLKLAIKDKYVLEDFKKDIKAEVDIQFIKRREGFVYKNKITNKERLIQGGDQAELRFSSAKMIQDLAKYGIHQNKTYDIGFPKALNSRYYPGFIAGVISGDGCIDIKKNHGKRSLLRCSIAGNLDLLENIKAILAKEIGMNPDKKIAKKKDSVCLHILELNQTETINLYYWLKENGVELMERKQQIIEGYLKEREFKAA